LIAAGGTAHRGAHCARAAARVVALVLVLACAVAIVPAAAAQPPSRAEAPGDDGLRIERHERVFVVDPDGSFTETIEEERAVTSAAGLAGASVRTFEWNAAGSTLTVLDAGVLKPGGERVEVPAQRIGELREPHVGGIYRDVRYTVIEYPEVEPGDRVYARVRMARAVPFFGGEFFDAKHAPPEAIGLLRITYDMPASMPLVAESRGFRLEGETRTSARIVYRWVRDGSAPPVSEPLAVSPFDHADRLFVTTFPDYRELARAYVRGSLGRADPTPEIRALAQRVVHGARTRRERAARLHAWVRGNIEHGGPHTGVSTVVPQAAQACLAAREGDCKDRAALFEALLASVGIDSSPVLVNAGNAFTLPGVATLGVFNHVITWIPSLATFADASASTVAFGDLPGEVAGKPALVAKSGEIVRTPMRPALTQRVSTTADGHGDGSASVVVVDTARGWLAQSRRQFFERNGADALEYAAAHLVAGSGLDGRAKLAPLAAPAPAPGTFAMKLEARVHGLLETDARGRRSLLAISGIGAGISSALAGWRVQVEHTVPSACGRFDVAERARHRLAPGVVLGTLPADRTVAGDGFAYRAAYRGAGRTLSVVRTLRVDQPGPVCTVARTDALRELVRRVDEDLRTRIPVRRERAGRPLRASRALRPAAAPARGRRRTRRPGTAVPARRCARSA